MAPYRASGQNVGQIFRSAICYTHDDGLGIGNYNKDGIFTFLQVNPIGKFGMIDFPCNYGLHKKVAQFLVNV